MSIENLIESYREDMIADLRRLVSFRSVRDAAKPGMPAGEPTSAALRYMLGRAEQMGFITSEGDGYMGSASYGAGSDYIAVIGHLDVVPEGDGWHHDPFGGEIENGKIYGRGTTDNKGACVAALYSLRALKDMGCCGTKEVRAMFGTMEESGMEDIVRHLSCHPEPVMALVPDAGYPIYNKQRGVYAFEIRCHAGDGRILSAEGGEKMGGIPGEASAVIDARGLDLTSLRLAAENLPSGQGNIRLEESENTVKVFATGKKGSTSYGHHAQNANLILLDFLARAVGPQAGKDIVYIQNLFQMETDGKSLGLRYDGEDFGIVSTGLCRLRVADGTASFLIDIRFPANQKLDAIRSRMASLFASYALREEKAYESHYVPEDGILCKILSGVYEETTGDRTRYLCNYGMNYSRFIQNGVAYGTGFPWDEPSPAHGADEFISVDSLLRHCVIHTKALIEMMK